MFLPIGPARPQWLRTNRARLARTEDPSGFAKAVESALSARLRDIHLGFFYDPDLYRRLIGGPGEADAARREERRRENFGFSEVALLAGNIGYIKLDEMAAVDQASGSRAVASMALVSETDAMIIDLRRNPGGSGRMGQLLSSYFFAEDQDRWLVSNANRSQNSFVQEWTQVYVPGRRKPATPLYLLVGPDTASAAEAFAYNLQALRRATVIGENTAGGAHSGDPSPIVGGFVAFIPAGRTINPVTGTNWERVGVTPDARTKASTARDKALALIWKDRGGKAAAGTSAREEALWHSLYHDAKVAQTPLGKSDLDLVGSYEDGFQVRQYGDWIFLHIGADPPNRLLPLANGTFAVEGRDHYGAGSSRIEVIRGPTGAVSAIRQLIRHRPSALARIEHGRL